MSTTEKQGQPGQDRDKDRQGQPQPNRPPGQGDRQGQPGGQPNR